MSRLLTASLLGCSSLALLTMTLACVGMPDAPHVPSPLAVADAIDSIIQPRFQVDAGVFGMSRISIRGHEAVLDGLSDTSLEKQMEAKSKQGHRAYTIGFFHCADKPGKFKPSDDPEWKASVATHLRPYYQMFYLVEKTLTTNGADGAPEPAAAAWDAQNSKRVQALCLKAMPQLKQGKDVAVTTDSCLIAMRPVRALKSSCINCHAGAHRGDTLGVMVYTVSLTTGKR